MQLKLTQFVEERKISHAKILPRQKFGFKNKEKKKKVGLTTTAATAEAGSRHSDAVDLAPTEERVKVAMTEVDLDPARTFIDRKGETIVLDPAVLNDGDVFIKNCEECVFFLRGSMGALRFENITRCTVITGPVTGGCFSEGAVDCKFHLVAHQLRLHHVTQSDFYVQVPTEMSSIIEDCNGLRFAPYAIEYLDLEQQCKEKGLTKEHCGDNWSRVQDFKWLRQQQSPNWCILPEAERVAPPLPVV